MNRHSYRLALFVLTCNFIIAGHWAFSNDRFFAVQSKDQLSKEKRAKQLAEQIQKLIRELDADEFQVREKATAQLITIGKPAIELLKKQENSKSAEVRFRVKKILNELLLEERQHAFYIVDLNGKLVRRIAVREMPHLGSPAWSPTGKKLAFDAWLTKEIQFSDTHIYVCNADGSNQKDLGTGAMPTWSPDEKQIAFHDYSPRSGIWIMKADGANRKRVYHTGNSPRWSPDGRYIAFTSGGLHLYDTKTLTIKKPKNPAFSSVNIGLSWSPDGKKICFTRRTKPPELVIADVDDSSKIFRVRFKGAIGSHTAWSPNGERIGFSLTKKGTPRQIYTINVDSKDPPQTLKGQVVNRINPTMDWSPDGKFAVYVSFPLKK